MSASAKAFALLRRTLPYLTVAVIIAVAYDGRIFYSRWSYRRQAEKAAARGIAGMRVARWIRWEAIA